MARFEVVDRGAGVAKSLHHFSAVNPRYVIRDAVTGQIIDEVTTKKVADGLAKLYSELHPNGMEN